MRSCFVVCRLIGFSVDEAADSLLPAGSRSFDPRRIQERPQIKIEANKFKTFQRLNKTCTYSAFLSYLLPLTDLHFTTLHLTSLPLASALVYHETACFAQACYWQLRKCYSNCVWYDVRLAYIPIWLLPFTFAFAWNA